MQRKKTKGSHMILGIFFLLMGLSILLKVFFHFDLPIMRTGFAVFIIYIGFKMLLGGIGRTGIHWQRSAESNDALFTEEDFEAPNFTTQPHKTYHTVFGTSRIDLSDVKVSDKDLKVELSTVFGETKVLINSKLPIRISANSVFGEAKMPDHEALGFGSLKYQSEAALHSPKVLEIHANVVFGAIRFTEKLDSAKKAEKD